MIIGAHSILYSKDPEADRGFLRDVVGLPHVDVGGGWLVFGLPPAEVAVHPADRNDVHEFYLMADDIHEFIADLARRGVACTPPQSLDWGVLTHVFLPGGGKLGVYEPRHARPEALGPAGRRASRPAPARKGKAGARKRPGRPGGRSR